jgi:hypothetical protein
MKIEKRDSGLFNIDCSVEEFYILCAALNNIEQQVDPQEYTTLMGATGEEINAVRKTMFAARGEFGEHIQPV